MARKIKLRLTMDSIAIAYTLCFIQSIHSSYEMVIRCRAPARKIGIQDNSCAVHIKSFE